MLALHYQLVPFAAIRRPKTIDARNLEPLVDSIREDGLVQPIVLESTEAGYLIQSGTRRWAAIEALLNEGHRGFGLVPAAVIAEEEVTP